MASSLLSYDLTSDNIDDAKLTGKVDLEDTLRRIAKEWLGTRKKCECGSNAACPICEIDYLLEEAFELPEPDSGCTHVYGRCDCR
jgi:hypothetical protein